MTPKGTDTFVILSPFGLILFISSLPIGSSNLEILIAEDFALSKNEADDLIMSAREKAYKD